MGSVHGTSTEGDVILLGAFPALIQIVFHATELQTLSIAKEGSLRTAQALQFCM